MQYYGLKTIVGSQKIPITLQNPSDSFYTITEHVSPYIEPAFTKEEFPSEKPIILLVSAVGASGKSTTAQALAFASSLPILDLAKHKPVGDATLTGIVTSAYPIERVGSVLEGLSKGTHGIIIDGIDEGRSKTTEQAFEAFLDDLIKLSKGASATTIVVFGRSQVLLSTWLYFAENGADVGLIRIDPFSLEQARGYIDAYVPERKVAQQVTYEQARDGVLQMLGTAFTPSGEDSDSFLSFIGYPPVLDAIATLLRTEQNYHRIIQALSDDADDDMEVTLLIRIGDFLLRREKNEKALPNFIQDLLAKVDPKLSREMEQVLFNKEEQCARILALALGEEFPLQVVPDVALNEEYEKALASWLQEHPFLDGERVRNAVFEAIAVARCVLSGILEYQAIALNYTALYPTTYHLLYIMSKLVGPVELDSRFFNMLVQSCSDFMGKGHGIEIELNGLSWEEPDLPAESPSELDVTVHIQKTSHQHNFRFKGIVSGEDMVFLEPLLPNATVTLPCDVTLKGSPTLDCTGACRISARRVRIDAPELIIRKIPLLEGESESGLFLDVRQALGHTNEIKVKSGSLEIACLDHNLTYPLAKYVQKTEMEGPDPDIQSKFIRLKRILQEFASHSRGGLAKYRAKIEHERVLRGELGEKILEQLLKEGVLYTDSKFYHVDSEIFADVLGITWSDLRQHRMSTLVEDFLKRLQ